MAAKKEMRRIQRTNRALRRWFSDRGLDLDEVWTPTSEELVGQNRQLEDLQTWVIEYERHHSLNALERRGLIAPPVDGDPELFERWLGPYQWPCSVELNGLEYAESLTDDRLCVEIDELVHALEDRGTFINIHDDVPAPIVFAYLKNELDQLDCERSSTVGFGIVDACDAYCPGCFQRPWCERGLELSWFEDEEAGRTIIPHEVEPYVLERSA